LQGIDTVLVPGVAAYSNIDQSATWARTLSLGSAASSTPVADLKNAVQNLRSSLANDLLLPAYVESTGDGAVTYLIPPSVLCGDASDAGADAAESVDGGCDARAAAHPLRLRVYRVACDAGQGVEIDWLVGTDRQLLLGVEFDAARIYARFFFAPLEEDGLAITSTASSSSPSADGGGSITTTVTTTVAQLDPGATGVLAATLETPAAGQAHAVIAIPEAISIGVTAPDGGAHVGLDLAAAAAVVDVTADSDAGVLQGSLGLADTRLTTTLSGFVQGFFGRSLVASANPNDPVVVETSGLDGQFAYAPAGDSLTFTRLGLGDAGARATHGGTDLLHVDVAPDAGGTVDFVATANDAGVAVAFSPSFGLAIRYSMSSVASEIDQLQPFASDDLLSITLAGANPSTAALFEDPDGSRPVALDLVGSQDGPLLRVGAGALDLTSTFAPDASVHVAATQCLVRTPGQAGVHDILKDLSAAACP
jgi:hypothetical protein